MPFFIDFALLCSKILPIFRSTTISSILTSHFLNLKPSLTSCQRQINVPWALCFKKGIFILQICIISLNTNHSLSTVFIFPINHNLLSYLHNFLCLALRFHFCIEPRALTSSMQNSLLPFSPVPKDPQLIESLTNSFIAVIPKIALSEAGFSIYDLERHS